MSDAGGKKIKL
jgi:hypothetical protein